MENAKELLELLTQHRLTLAVAESLTGGMLSSALVGVPGASLAFMEGFVTYDTGAKMKTLGVPAEVIDSFGAVSEETAGFMAQKAAQKAVTDMGISTTGVAGPDPSEGKPVGLVYVGVYFRGAISVRRLMLTGSREEIRRETVREAIALALSVLRED